MSPPVGRREFLALGTAALAGCATVGSRVGGQQSPEPESTARSSAAVSTPTTGGKATGTAGGATTSASTTSAGTAPPMADRVLPLPMAADSLESRVVSGGPPKDGIPSIDDPQFESAASADTRLQSNSIVFGLASGGVAKAYPQLILVWHEICNDVIDGTPVSVTYCPLTGTTLGFDRGETTFGVSGRLVNNNLIMYDRGTERWWPQVLGTSIPSPWNDDRTRHSLSGRRVIWTTWSRWKAVYPETRVLTRDTGYARNYGSDPYGSYDYPDRSGYYAPDRSPLFPSLSSDDRYPPKSVVIGARTPDGAVAFRKPTLRQQGVMAGELADDPVIGVFDPRFDTGYVYRNPDNKAYELRDGRVVGGDGTARQPDALDLERIHAFDAMWFAWSGFYPTTSVYG